MQKIVVCFFVCFGIFVLFEIVFTHLETSVLPVKGFKFGHILGTHGHSQWEFFNVPHLLWHKLIVYNGHIRGPVTLTPVAERLAVELSLGTCFNDVTAAVKYEKFRVPVNQTRQFLFLFCGTSLNVLRQIILKLICLHLPSHVLWLKRVSIIITLLNRSFRWRSSWWGYRRSNVPDEHECPCKQIIQKHIRKRSMIR